MPDKKINFNFEASLDELSQIVEKMESGQLSLEESLGYFEQGVKLTKQCQQALNQANRRVEQLMKEQDDGLLSTINTIENGNEPL